MDRQNWLSMKLHSLFCLIVQHVVNSGYFSHYVEKAYQNFNHKVRLTQSGPLSQNSSCKSNEWKEIVLFEVGNFLKINESFSNP